MRKFYLFFHIKNKKYKNMFIENKISFYAINYVFLILRPNKFCRIEIKRLAAVSTNKHIFS